MGNSLFEDSILRDDEPSLLKGWMMCLSFLLVGLLFIVPAFVSPRPQRSIVLSCYKEIEAIHEMLQSAGSGSDGGRSEGDCSETIAKLRQNGDVALTSYAVQNNPIGVLPWTDPWKHSYRYKVDGKNGTLTVWSCGPNGVNENGTHDDIVMARSLSGLWGVDTSWQYWTTNSTAVIGSGRMYVPAISYAQLGGLVVPEKMGGLPVGEVGRDALYGCTNVVSVTIPEGVTEVGIRAFAGCRSLTKVKLPESLTTIGPGAFMDCVSIREIAIPSNVKSIGRGVFANCSRLEKITLPDGVSYIPEKAFSNCERLMIVEIPSSVTNVGHYAFSRCTALRKVVLPSSVIHLGRGAFYGCTSLEQCEIPGGVSVVLGGTFRECCNLREIIIREGVHKIESDAFYMCSNLTQVKLPASATNVSKWAFRDCPMLRTGLPIEVRPK